MQHVWAKPPDMLAAKGPACPTASAPCAARTRAHKQSLRVA